MTARGRTPLARGLVVVMIASTEDAAHVRDAQSLASLHATQSGRRLRAQQDPAEPDRQDAPHRHSTAAPPRKRSERSEWNGHGAYPVSDCWNTLHLTFRTIELSDMTRSSAEPSSSR
ncbi:hypothetical protein BC628DRAFT_1366042 [Trametes gibbosa]|nr:hypothetical protein BC628DRAFT_1366042 [Trametes gibbosa]